MGGTAEIIKSTYSDAWNLLKKSWRKLLIDIIKVQIVIFLLSLITGAFVVFGIDYFIGDASNTYELLQNIPVWYYAIAIPTYIAVGLLSAITASLMYNIVDNRAKGKKTNFTEQFSRNIIPVTIYSVLWWVFMIITLLPMLGIIGGGMGAMALMCVYPLALLIIYLLLLFFLQFAYLEIIVARKGVIQGLKDSLTIVKKNMFAVFIFDISYIVASIAVSIPFYAFYMLSGWIGQLASMAIGDVLIGGLASIVISSIGMAIMKTALMFVLLPLLYFFWKKIRE